MDGSITPITSPMAAHGEVRGELAVVRSLALVHAVEIQFVAADRDRLPGLELGDALAAPLRLADDPEQRDAEPEMRKRGAPGRSRQTVGARPGGA